MLGALFGVFGVSFGASFEASFGAPYLHLLYTLILIVSLHIPDTF